MAVSVASQTVFFVARFAFRNREMNVVRIAIEEATEWKRERESVRQRQIYSKQLEMYYVRYTMRMHHTLQSIGWLTKVILWNGEKRNESKQNAAQYGCWLQRPVFKCIHCCTHTNAHEHFIHFVSFAFMHLRCHHHRHHYYYHCRCAYRVWDVSERLLCAAQHVHQLNMNVILKRQVRHLNLLLFASANRRAGETRRKIHTFGAAHASTMMADECPLCLISMCNTVCEWQRLHE